VDRAQPDRAGLSRQQIGDGDLRWRDIVASGSLGRFPTRRYAPCAFSTGRCSCRTGGRAYPVSTEASCLRSSAPGAERLLQATSNLKHRAASWTCTPPGCASPSWPTCASRTSMASGWWFASSRQGAEGLLRHALRTV